MLPQPRAFLKFTQHSRHHPSSWIVCMGKLSVLHNITGNARRQNDIILDGWVVTWKAGNDKKGRLRLECLKAGARVVSALKASPLSQTRRAKADWRGPIKKIGESPHQIKQLAIGIPFFLCIPQKIKKILLHSWFGHSRHHPQPARTGRRPLKSEPIIRMIHPVVGYRYKISEVLGQFLDGSEWRGRGMLGLY
jgi:hypothetical protein